jgi:hypothetical protein
MITKQREKGEHPSPKKAICTETNSPKENNLDYFCLDVPNNVKDKVH